jgi:hypothetical protein
LLKFKRSAVYFGRITDMIFNKRLCLGALKVAASLACTSVFSCVAAADGGYTYRVAFDGDFDSAHDEAFYQLISGLSNGSTDPGTIKIDVDGIIANEKITDDGFLEVSFSDAAVKNLIGSGKVTVWNGLREPLLIWMTRGTMVDYVDNEGTVDSRAEARIVVSGERDGFIDALIARGNLEKVRTILPLNDLDDMAAVSISDVMSGNQEKIAAASSKYTGGIAVASLLTANDGKLQFTYYFIDVATGKRIYSQTAEGTASEVVDEFYRDLKTCLGSKRTSSSEIRSERGTEREVSTYLDGYSDVSGLNLGMRPNGTYVVLVKNTPNFDTMVDIKNNFLKAGFNEAEVVDVKGGDVVYSLTSLRTVSPDSVMDVFQALERDAYTPGVFYFNSAVDNIIVIPDESKKSTGASASSATTAAAASSSGKEAAGETSASRESAADAQKEPSAAPVQINRPQRADRGRRKSNGLQLDPNKRYKTGGGVQ